jgi:acyl carrier protein
MEDSVRERVIAVLGEFSVSDLRDVGDEFKLCEDLGLESIDLVSVCARLQEIFSIKIANGEDLRLVTVGDVVDLVNSKPSRSAMPEKENRALVKATMAAKKALGAMPEKEKIQVVMALVELALRAADK